ncbi:MAG: trigger factor [Planctomycetota bacterium]
MSETTADKISTSTVKENGPTSRTLAIEVSAETIAARLGESFDALLTEVALPGFRKGHAPKQLVEKRFGDRIREEAKGQLVSTAYSEAIDEHGLKVVGDPVAEQLDLVEIVDGEPLRFEVEVEVRPEFDMPELDGLELKRPVDEVTDDLIDAEAEKLCLAEGDLEERESAEPGDYITGRGVMKAGDTVIHDIEGAVVQIPKDKSEGMILGVLVGDLQEQLGAPKPGETVSVSTTGPENHENEAARGAELAVTFDVETVARIIPAELAAIAERVGMEDEAALREALRGQMEQKLESDRGVLLRQQVAKYLLEKVQFDLPKRLTARQASSVLERRRAELMYRGMDAAQIEENIARLRAASATEAVRELKLLFILSRVAEAKEVSVAEAELNGAIVSMARRQNQRPEALRDQLIKSGQINTIYQQMMEHKALDAIVASAKIDDVTAEEWNEYAKSLNEAGVTAGESGSSS